MDFRYKWKNGTPPSRDKAANDANLLDESQFETQQDQELAEESARKHLNLPVRIPDDEKSILPHAAPDDRVS
ncbi:MAG: hypothetical protein WCA35_29295 [Kovacikia sp.]